MPATTHQRKGRHVAEVCHLKCSLKRQCFGDATPISTSRLHLSPQDQHHTGQHCDSFYVFVSLPGLFVVAARRCFLCLGWKMVHFPASWPVETGVDGCCKPPKCPKMHFKQQLGNMLSHPAVHCGQETVKKTASARDSRCVVYYYCLTLSSRYSYNNPHFLITILFVRNTESVWLIYCWKMTQESKRYFKNARYTRGGL